MGSTSISKEDPWLVGLPLIGESFSGGEINYSRLRGMESDLEEEQRQSREIVYYYKGC